MKILVVDDDKITRQMFLELLSKDGHLITTVESGIKAIEKMKSFSFDFVIVDLKMPGIDGIEVLKRIKIMNPSTHVIIITAYGTVDKAVEALKGGAVDFIEKPFKLKKVQEIIKRISAEKMLDKNKMIFIEKSPGGVKQNEEFIELFKKNLTDGNGLCVTLHNASYIREKYDLENIEIIEVTELISNNNFDDEKSQDLVDKIYAFIRTNPKSVVLMDGFDYFINNYSQSFIEKFLFHSYHELLQTTSKMILYVNTNTLPSTKLESFVATINNVMMNIGMNSLSNPTEIDIVEYLFEHPESTFNDIYQNINLDKSSKLSFYLQKLHTNQIIKKVDKKYSIGPKGDIMVKTLEFFKNIEFENYQNSLLVICEKN